MHPFLRVLKRGLATASGIFQPSQQEIEQVWDVSMFGCLAVTSRKIMIPKPGALVVT
jgi:hypothetical protein